MWPKIIPREETLDFCLLQCDNLDRICWKSWLWLSDWLFLQKFYFSGRKTGISRSQPIKPGNLETLLLLFSWLRAIFLMNYFAIFMPLKQSLCKYIFSLWQQFSVNRTIQRIILYWFLFGISFNTDCMITIEWNLFWRSILIIIP